MILTVMNQIPLLIEALKRCLKAKGLTYSDLAKELGISEPTVKRCFAKNQFTLMRLEEICEVIGITFVELARMVRSEDIDESGRLNESQEHLLASDPKIFAIFYLLLSGVSADQISRHYRMTQIEISRALVKLERVNLLRTPSKSRVQMLVKKNVQWIPNGTLFKLYAQAIRGDFLHSNFNREDERLRLLNGRFSEHSLRFLQRKIDKIIRDFLDIAEADLTLSRRRPDKQIWFIVGYRPWTFSELLRLKR